MDIASTIIVIVIALILVPPLRLMLRNMIGGLELTAVAFDDSMKTGSMSIMDANEEQRLKLIQKRKDRVDKYGKKIPTADELLLSYLEP